NMVEEDTPMEDTESVLESKPKATMVRPNYEEALAAAQNDLVKTLDEFKQLILTSATNEEFEANEKRQALLTRVIERMEKAVSVKKKDWSIPPNLPSLQMQGDTDTVANKPIYVTIDRFVEAFDTIMRQHELDLDLRWEACFVTSIQHSVDKTTWFKKQLEGQKLDWSQARSIIEQQFGGDFTLQ
ncbi:hypothetical protein, partial, partial [Absidia glauca]